MGSRNSSSVGVKTGHSGHRTGSSFCGRAHGEAQAHGRVAQAGPPGARSEPRGGARLRPRPPAAGVPPHPPEETAHDWRGTDRRWHSRTVTRRRPPHFAPANDGQQKRPSGLPPQQWHVQRPKPTQRSATWGNRISRMDANAAQPSPAAPGTAPKRAEFCAPPRPMMTPTHARAAWHASGGRQANPPRAAAARGEPAGLTASRWAAS